MDSSQKDKLVVAKNKLHQIHLEAEEKKRLQAEKEQIQAENRAKRAGSRAPAPSTQPSGMPASTIVGILEEPAGTEDADGEPIDPTGTEAGPNVGLEMDGDDESSEAENEKKFKLALKKKISTRQVEEQVPSLERSSRRIKDKSNLTDYGFCFFAWQFFSVPTAADKQSGPPQNLSMMDELNWAVEFGTAEEARAALVKVDAVLKRATHLDAPPAGRGDKPHLEEDGPEPSAPLDRPATKSSKPKRKPSVSEEDPSSPPSNSEEETPKRRPKKRSKSKKKKSKKSSDDPSSSGDSTPSELPTSDDSSALHVLTPGKSPDLSVVARLSTESNVVEGSGASGTFVKKNNFYKGGKQNGSAGTQKSQVAESTEK
ncbi:uncharacterized protein MELLADRAFT_64400 [Melampsora larici-populina 98AG31]|uniref:Uncharacterized protein n=1 Tax=Melampsora larici-populina (strain 98AG31 / pathotype 3-4-7) TaxID=747676 RepID=F4RRA3_MELLP|nr:uncharacterized protein MELLADRAFT_64400 [Melampsora larici-populina 98AG31]EGG05185.1 hypothetical protein MELLADRAFT_64400 [Melampsora larici-populina 98AG31]